MSGVPGVDTVLEDAANKAVTYGANILDRWTKNRDAKRADSAFSTSNPAVYSPNGPAEMPLGVFNHGYGASSYASAKYSHLAQWPMFTIYSTNDQHVLAWRAKHAANMRGEIREVHVNPLQRLVLSLSGGGMIFTVNKAQNALARLNAQTSESLMDQKNLCLITRWTLPASGPQHPARQLLVDILEFRVQGPMNINTVTFCIKANADVKMNMFGKLTVGIKRNKSKTEYIKGLLVDETVHVVFDDGSTIAMEVVAYESRLISTAEIDGGLGKKQRGTRKRFEKDWMVPIAYGGV